MSVIVLQKIGGGSEGGNGGGSGGSGGGGSGGSNVTPSPTPENSIYFDDVYASSWFHDDVMYVAERGLMNGVEQGVFAPQMSITRGMLVAILGRMSDVNAQLYPAGAFADVLANQYYAPYVEWARLNNVVQGFEDGMFRPDNAITRQDAAVIFRRYASFTGKTLKNSGFYAGLADGGQVAEYARSAVYDLMGARIILGDDAGNFKPQAHITRAESAAILHRFISAVDDDK
jgi:hypothetical protein